MYVYAEYGLVTMEENEDLMVKTAQPEDLGSI